MTAYNNKFLSAKRPTNTKDISSVAQPLIDSAIAAIPRVPIYEPMLASGELLLTSAGDCLMAKGGSYAT
jgi:hypothetical protein